MKNEITVDQAALGVRAPRRARGRRAVRAGGAPCARVARPSPRTGLTVTTHHLVNGIGLLLDMPATYKAIVLGT